MITQYRDFMPPLIILLITEARPFYSCVAMELNHRNIFIEFNGQELAQLLPLYHKATVMIRKLKSGYRIYSRKKDPKTGKRKNLGTFSSMAAAKKHEREIQYFKHH